MKTILSIALIFTITLADAQTLFPNKCIGNWKGVMKIYSKGVLKDTVTVLLTIKKQTDTSWMWKTEYISTKMPVTKNYTLRLKDKINGIYITDEGDGIELKDYLFDNKLYNIFETEGIMLTSFYELRGKELYFEVTSGKKIVADAKEVINYSINNIQKVVFKKIKYLSH
jgi:hypothetical protein